MHKCGPKRALAKIMAGANGVSMISNIEYQVLSINNLTLRTYPEPKPKPKLKSSTRIGNRSHVHAEGSSVSHSRSGCWLIWSAGCDYPVIVERREAQLTAENSAGYPLVKHSLAHSCLPSIFFSVCPKEKSICGHVVSQPKLAAQRFRSLSPSLSLFFLCFALSQ